MNYDCWELVLKFCENPCLLSLVCKTWKFILIEQRFYILLRITKKMHTRLNSFWYASNPMFQKISSQSGYNSPPLFPDNSNFIL